jgi:putative nucleotidyltransferase with HDIG domain
MTNIAQIDWMGLIIISILIALSEGFSINLYVRESSISTSAIPILVAYMILGPIGVVCASLVIAISLYIKYHSHHSKFVFNFSNHLLAGTLCLGLVSLAGGNILRLPTLYQIVISLLLASVLYLTTTWLVAIGMSINLEQPVLRVWADQFGWLAPYYLGIGFISYAMIFGYKFDHITGLLVMVIPMILLRISQAQYVGRTHEVVTELREKNQIMKKKSEEIVELNEGLLVTLSEIIDLRDPYVLGHSKQVSNIAANIAKLLRLNEKQIDLVRKAGLLHDIGKLGIPMDILSKPGKLTHDEYEIIKTHAALGGDLVKDSPSLRPLVSIIRNHHEFFDGRGYPDKLSGNQISIEARIIAVADAIEAMTSDRPYRKALKPEQVIDEITRFSGSQFDPLVVEEAIKILKTTISNQGNPPDQQDSVAAAPQFTINMEAS